jgi:DMSO reductase anchor subunit
MRPAFSVVFLTTLIGAGQGLFLAMYAAEAGGALGWVDQVPPRRFFVAGSMLSLALCALGLAASFFHLGRPERAWRTAAMWRTSWLSREVIALPLFMALAFAYGWSHYTGRDGTVAIGAAALAACLALFYCTAMIYACIKFLQEWASPFTLPNFLLMGCASGATLAAALSTLYVQQLSRGFAIAAAILTAAALASRLASLVRNARIVHKSSLQTAIGVANPRIRQISQGFTGNSFNTLEFFHGLPAIGMRAIPVAFVVLAFVLPLVLIGIAIVAVSSGALAIAWVVQYAGLLLERWHFLAQSEHPQNLYYQNRS